MSTGNEGCSCINTTSVLASLEDRKCTTASGLPGVYRLGGSCIAYDFGSSACLRHDLIHDPICQRDDLSSAVVVPEWCFQSWCYVDGNSCKKNSEEDVFKSDSFPQLDIYYSYTTCNSTDSFWLDYVDSSLTNASVAGGVNISAVVPSLDNPVLHKKLPDGTLVSYLNDVDDMYYFDDSIPFGGIYIDYVNSIIQLSKGDIQNMTFTHTSRASLKRYPMSSYTAAVQDVERGLVDMAVGPFWITGQRLRMTSYTIPLVNDKTVLVIPRPGTKNNLGYEIQKVLEPFTYGLWGVAIAIIIVASLLSVWFSDREMAAKKRYGMRLRQSKKPMKKRKTAYFRLMLDAMLEKGMFFFSAGIEQDTGASLPHKVLMFGFGFFILIAVSAYVANLAAFLTQTGFEKSVGSMKEVINRGIPICGHPALEEEIRLKWPDAKWVFPGSGFEEMIEAYAKGECKVMAMGREDTIMDMNFLNKMCEHDLVYTDVLVTENPIAFPIKEELASAFSYWMYLGEKTYGIDLDSAKQAFLDKNDIKPQCEVELSQLSGAEEADDFARVSPGNMIFPIILFLTCALIAAVLQLYHDRMTKKGRTVDFGRKSSLDMYLESFAKRLSVNTRLSAHANNDAGEGGPTRPYSNGVRFTGDFPEDNIFDDEFNENGPPRTQSSPGSGPTSRGSRKEDTDKDKDKANGIELTDTTRHSNISEIFTGNAAAAVNVEENDIDQRLEELVVSGMIDEVLDCFDFLQEMKLKKER